MAFETPEQFYAAVIEEARIQTGELLRIREGIERLLDAVGERAANEHVEQLHLVPAPLPTALAEMVAAFSNERGSAVNGHSPVRVSGPRTDPFGQELPRGVSWDASGDVWQVDVTTTGRGRRRIRIPEARFPGRPEAGLAEACIVRAVMRGVDVKANLQRLHPDSARDVAEAMAR